MLFIEEQPTDCEIKIAIAAKPMSRLSVADRPGPVLGVVLRFAIRLVVSVDIRFPPGSCHPSLGPSRLVGQLAIQKMYDLRKSNRLNGYSEFSEDSGYGCFLEKTSRMDYYPARILCGKSQDFTNESKVPVCETNNRYFLGVAPFTASVSRRLPIN